MSTEPHAPISESSTETREIPPAALPPLTRTQQRQAMRAKPRQGVTFVTKPTLRNLRYLGITR